MPTQPRRRFLRSLGLGAAALYGLAREIGARGRSALLAALAFLFAVFRARPSPFYVLDEVEAALDDANLRRFLRLVATLRESAQVIIITHQQQTMEAADILYGVTMEEPGVSKLVSVRFT